MTHCHLTVSGIPLTRNGTINSKIICRLDSLKSVDNVCLTPTYKTFFIFSHPILIYFVFIVFIFLEYNRIFCISHQLKRRRSCRFTLTFFILVELSWRFGKKDNGFFSHGIFESFKFSFHSPLRSPDTYLFDTIAHEASELVPTLLLNP